MRILVVEDDPDLARQLEAALGDAGYVVDLAADGEEGHFLGDTEPYDAVILDLGLPVIDGLTVLERWRRAAGPGDRAAGGCRPQPAPGVGDHGCGSLGAVELLLLLREGLLAGDRLQVLAEVALECRLQAPHVRARVAQDLGAPLVVQHGVEQVLHRHEGVAARPGLPHGGPQHQVELSSDVAHSFSVPARRG